MDFKTKKAAREAGFKTHEEWVRQYPAMAPRHDANGVTVKDEPFYSVDDCEELVSKTEAGQKGLKVPPDAVAVAQKHTSSHGKSMHYNLYRISDCVAKRRVKEIPPRDIDLLLATFTVNKAAKRYRDSASSNYEKGQHGFSQSAKATKETLYALKECGIATAFVEGRRLEFCGTHGRLAIYRGEGYCFHSLLVPKDAGTEPAQDEARIFVESAPKGTTEARLKDACFTLNKCCVNEALFTRVELPKHKRPKRLFARLRAQDDDDSDDDDSGDDDSGDDDSGDDDWEF